MAERKRSALQQGIAYLSRREYSRQELSRRLGDCGYALDEICTALDRLVAEGWQDDARFAQAFSRMRANAGYGPGRIRLELQRHHIREDLVAVALQPYDGKWVEIGADWVLRRYGGGSEFRQDVSAQRKAADFLLRRGFDHGAMRAALDAARNSEIA